MQEIRDLAASKALLRDIYITDDLAARSPGAIDFAGEKRAILELAAVMAEKPTEVLPRFVELAMALTGGAAAGLCLYEPDPAPGVFRWHCLHGSLAEFEGALTPRDDSPCGVTLDQNRPVLAHHPEAIYSWISDANIVVPEVLLVPLLVGGREPMGTLWIVAPREGYFTSTHADIASDLARFAGSAVKLGRDAERLHAALEEQELLAREMSHRLNNVFAVTNALIGGSARHAKSVDELAKSIKGRLGALAVAHGQVNRLPAQSRAASDTREADFDTLVRSIVDVHEGTDPGQSTFCIEGPKFTCHERAINAFALVLHELGTNATKYGALSVAGGTIDIHWALDEQNFQLHWSETGGPRIAAPASASGFGSMLIRRTIERQLRGTIVYDWRPEGLHVAIVAPLGMAI